MINKPHPLDTAQGTTSTVGNCTLHVSHGPDDMPIIKVVGEVDIAGAAKTYVAMWRASGNGNRSLILDLEEMDFMDSSGLQAFLRLREKLRSRKQKVFLVAAKPQIKKLLRLTGFDKLFIVLDSTAQVRESETGGSSEK